jgi:hypothetical protein
MELSEPREHEEAGRIGAAVEDHVAKVPRSMFLWAAGFSIAGSLLLQIVGKKQESLFVGQWAPTFLILAAFKEIRRRRSEPESIVH